MKKRKRRKPAPVEALQGAADGRRGILESRGLHILLITLTGILVYSNTLHAPFQWDEDFFILGNPYVEQFPDAPAPRSASEQMLFNAFRGRPVGYATFALNYALHGRKIVGYHVFNITVHLFNAVLVYIFLMLVVRTPVLGESLLAGKGRWLPFLSGLLFVAHPVQTEAVTYIFQRHASLVAFFSLGAITAYTGARLTGKKSAAAGLYILSLLYMVLAMKSKENAFTVPVVVLLLELLFFRGRFGPRLLRLLPIMLTMIIIPFSVFGSMSAETLGGAVKEVLGTDVKASAYLFTQFRVIVTYLRLLILPVGQNADYDYPLYTSFFATPVVVSFFFLTAVFLSSIWLLWRTREGGKEWRLVSFGILWFFVTLSVESSIIPIPMTINEYRMYLPSVGFIVAVLGVLFILIPTGRADILLWIFAGIAVAFSIAAYQRNSAWRTGITFWEDVTRKSPQKARGRLNLGKAYYEAGMKEDALRQFKKTVELSPNYPLPHFSLGRVYKDRGALEQALEEFQKAVELDPGFARAHNELGNVYFRYGRMDDALNHLEIAVRLEPGKATNHNNLAIIYATLGEFEKAREHFETALKIDPGFEDASGNLEILKKNLTNNPRHF